MTLLDTRVKNMFSVQIDIKLGRMTAELESAKKANGGNLPAGSEKRIAYIEVMRKAGISF